MDIQNIGNSILIHGDCIEAMDNMIAKGITVDCIITDPPYLVTSRGSAGNSGGMMQKDINKKGLVFDNNNCSVKDWGKRIYQLLKDGGHCYIMTNHKNLIEYLNTLTGFGFHFIKSLIWQKGNKIMGQFYMSEYEYILFFRKGKGIKINECGTGDILPYTNIKHKDDGGKNLHDTEKPVGLMEVLVRNSSKEGETVMDFTMGIGATGVACKKLNRNFIGIEIDDKYFNIAKKRIEENKW